MPTALPTTTRTSAPAIGDASSHSALAPPAGPNDARLDFLRRRRAEMYRTGKLTAAAGHQIELLPTALTEIAGECLRDLLLRECDGPPRTIEVGLALGMSALYLIEALLQRGAPWPHTAIDPHQTQTWGDCAVLAAASAGVGDRLHLVQEDSLLALPRLVAAGEQFDFAFVDGGHHYENAFIDTYYMHRLVRPGGLIVVDDVWMPSVRSAVSYFVTNLGTSRVTADPRVAKRFAILRTPLEWPERHWTHFVPFSSDPEEAPAEPAPNPA